MIQHVLPREVSFRAGVDVKSCVKCGVSNAMVTLGLDVSSLTTEVQPVLETQPVSATMAK